MPRITKVSTRKGDDSTTSLGGGQRVPKDSLRVQAYGAVDELNSLIGVALVQDLSPRLAETLPAIQNELFHLGSDLSHLEEVKLGREVPQIEARHVIALEKLIDEILPDIGPLDDFILPGGAPGAATLHLARAVCRRAEREVIALSRQEAIGPFVQKYLNRLSDALFVMARLENKRRDVSERYWDSRA